LFYINKVLNLIKVTPMLMCYSVIWTASWTRSWPQGIHQQTSPTKIGGDTLSTEKTRWTNGRSVETYSNHL